MSGVEDLRTSVLDRHFEQCEFFVPERSGEITVGLVDSIYDPDDFSDFNRFGRSFDVINANVGATNGHGYEVLQMLTYFAHDPEYHLFQAVDESGRTRDSVLMKAVGKAMAFEEVDVLNVSVGCGHVSSPDRDCTETRAVCALCEVVEAAAECGITVVAAAGNDPNFDAVCCPSLSEDAISVGGVVSRCTANPEPGSTLNPTPSVSHPPNAYWVDREDGDGAQGAFCSGRGCRPGESCRENELTELWSHNVAFTDRNPDTLAPVHLPAVDEVGPLILEGTSFAAPIVSAGIANVLGWARSGNDDFSPVEIRRAVGNSGMQIETADAGVFSAASFANELRSERGRRPVDFHDSGPFDSGDMFDN